LNVNQFVSEPAGPIHAEMLRRRKILREKFYGRGQVVINRVLLPAPSPIEKEEPKVRPKLGHIRNSDAHVWAWREHLSRERNMAVRGFHKTLSAAVVEDICRASGLKPSDIKKGDKYSRRRKVARWRQVFFWAMRYYGDMSLNQIGHLLGGFDHTTVLYGIQKIEGGIADGRLTPFKGVASGFVLYVDEDLLK